MNCRGAVAGNGCLPAITIKPGFVVTMACRCTEMPMQTLTVLLDQRVFLRLCPWLKSLMGVSLLALLVACGGEEGATAFDDSGKGGLYYSYPYDGQQAVPPHAPIVLRFSDPVSLDASNVSLYECAPDARRCDASSAVASVALAAPHSSGNGRGVVLAPDVGALKTGTGYSLVLNDLVIDDQRVSLPNGLSLIHI